MKERHSESVHNMPLEYSQRNLGFVRKLAIKAAILAPAAFYVACGGGGHKDEGREDVAHTQEVENHLLLIEPDVPAAINNLVPKVYVYIETSNRPVEELLVYLAGIQDSFRDQKKTRYAVSPAAEPEPAPPPYVSPPEVTPGGGNKIILTFDDSGPQATSILDILGRYGTKAIFFPNGNWASGNPVVARMLDEGHLVCNHTRDHADLTTLSYEGVKSEILGGAGVGSCNLLRPPYGAHNSFVDSVAAELGYSIYMWDIDTRDWATRYAGGDQVILNIVLSQAYPGAVVLMHMHVDNTVSALPAMIEGLQKAGYELHW